MEQNEKNVMNATDYQFNGYISTVVSEVYKDMPAGTPFPAQYWEDMNRYVFRDEFLDTDLPAVYTYFSSVKPGGTPMGIFAKCARKTRNIVSVGRYTQVAGWAWSEGELYRDSFESLLDFGFYSEEEIDTLAAGGNVAPFGSSRDGMLQAVPVEIHPSALKVLVYAAYLIWQRSNPLVRIAVPAEYTGDAYNAYVLGAVRTLYSYFPVGLRSKAGFTSYLPAGKDKGLNNLYFAFVPQAQAGPNAVYLDGSSLPVYEKMGKTVMIADLDFFIEYTLKLKDPVQRAEFIAKVFADVDGGDKKIRDLFPSRYTCMAAALRLLNPSGSALETMPQWIHVCNHPEEFPVSMQQELHSAIRREVTPAVFQEYLEARYPDSMKLNAFGDQYEDVRNISCEADALRACFWDRLKSIMLANRTTPTEAMAFLEAHKKGLQKIHAEAYAQLYASYKQKLGEDVLKTAYASVDESMGASQVLRSNIAQTIKRANEELAVAYEEEERAPLLNKIKERGSQRVVAYLRKQFEPIPQMPAENAEQIRAAIEAAQKLKDELGEETTAGAEELRRELDGFIEGKRSALGGYDVLCTKVTTELAAMEDYFQAIAHIAHAIREHSVFEESDQKRFLAQIRNLRPGKEEAYKDQFQRYSGNPLTMENLCNCDPLVVTCALEDLAQFFREPYVLGKSEAQKMYNAIVRRQAVMDQFSAGEKLTVSLDGRRVDAELLKQILAPECGVSVRQGADETVKALVMELAEAGVYSGRHMASLCQMFICYGLKLAPLLECACSGVFRNSQEEDYQALFEAVFQALKEKKKDPLEQMSKAVDRKGSDDTAQKAYKRFRKAHEGKKGAKLHPGWITSIALGVVAVTLVGTTVWLVLSANHLKGTIGRLESETEGKNLNIQNMQTELQANKDLIAGLKADMERLVDLNFLDGDRTAFTASIRTIAALEESDGTYQVYNDRYRTYNKDFVVARIGEEDITWGEYFLWECFFAGKEENTAADTFLSDALQTKVQRVLMLTYGSVDAPENVEAVETPAEEEQQEPVAILTPEEQTLKLDADSLIAEFEEMLISMDSSQFVLAEPGKMPEELLEETEEASAEISDEQISATIEQTEEIAETAETAETQQEPEAVPEDAMG